MCTNSRRSSPDLEPDHCAVKRPEQAKTIPAALLLSLQSSDISAAVHDCTGLGRGLLLGHLLEPLCCCVSS